MKVRIRKILIVISIIVFSCGLLAGLGIVFQFASSFLHMGEFPIDGTDFAPLIGMAALAASIFIAIGVAKSGLLLVGVLWAVYGIVCLVQWYLRKRLDQKSGL